VLKAADAARFLCVFPCIGVSADYARKSSRVGPGLGAFLHLDPRRSCQKVLVDGEVVSIHEGAVEGPHSSYCTLSSLGSGVLGFKTGNSVLLLASQNSDIRHAETITRNRLGYSDRFEELSRLAVSEDFLFPKLQTFRPGVGFLHRSLYLNAPAGTLYRSCHASQSTPAYFSVDSESATKLIAFLLERLKPRIADSLQSY
jgi:hypothetical protein